MRARVLVVRSIIAIAGLVLLAACPGDPAGAPPVLTLSPSTLSYSAVAGGANPAAQTVQVSNAGTGTLSWTATSSAAWLTIASSTGSLTASVSTAGLAVGTHQATITVTAPDASNSPQTVAVTLTLTEPPTMTLGSASLTFAAVQGGANPSAQSVTLSFSSGSPAWTSSDDASWLTVSPASGTGAGQLTASVNTAGLSAGTHTATITVTAGAINSPQTVAVTLTLAPPPVITLSTSQLSFSANVGANPSNQTFDVSNTGGGTLTFTASDDAPWLTLTPTSGTAPVSVTASVASSAMTAGTYTGTITVAASGASNTPQTISVTLVVADFSGTWPGKTSQDSTVRLVVGTSGITQIYLGWRVASCGTSGTSTVNFGTPVSITGGSFSRSVSGSPLSFTISGTFTSGTAVSGNLVLNFSMSVPFSCSSTVNLTWSATKQ